MKTSGTRESASALLNKKAALKDLIRAAVALNVQGKSKATPQRANSKRAIE